VNLFSSDGKASERAANTPFDTRIFIDILWRSCGEEEREGDEGKGMRKGAHWDGGLGGMYIYKHLI
jgi:hypothetical protein